jgi:hypothetical protein
LNAMELTKSCCRLGLIRTRGGATNRSLVSGRRDAKVIGYSYQSMEVG